MQEAERHQNRHGRVDLGIIMLTVTTAAIHGKNGSRLPLTFGWPMYLNGLGYLALLGLLYLPCSPLGPVRRLVRSLLIGYTVLTIMLYFGFGIMTSFWSFPKSPLAKLIYALLIGLARLRN